MTIPPMGLGPLSHKNFRGTGAQADAVWLAPTASTNTIFIYRIQFTTDAAASVQITDGADAAGTRLFDGDLGDNGGAIMDLEVHLPLTLTQGASLLVTTSAGNFKGVIHYIEG